MVQKMMLDALVRSIGVSKDKPLLIFLGAGASISSGMPSAAQCIWEWKRSIFLTNNPGVERQFDELSLPSVRQRIQKWCDAQRTFPAEDAPEEYSFYIEQCLPRADDRRRFFETWTKKAQPGLGYQLLAELAKQRLMGAIWTTNFDSLAVRAATALGIPVIEVGKDVQERALRPISDDEVEHVALHGDYRYDKLSNTTRELAGQEQMLREHLLRSLKANPVLVCGYSGRDASVMEVFRSAYAGEMPSRQPLFWTQYSDAEAKGHLLDLLDGGGNEHEKYLVSGVTFDDLMRRIALHASDVDCRDTIYSILEKFKESPVAIRTPFLLPNLPVTGLVKSNAYPMQPPGELLMFDLKAWPARGSVWSSLGEISNAHGFVAAPFNGRVYALASPAQVQRAFSENIAGEVKRVPLNDEDLQYEDGTANQLMRRATTIALARKSGLSCDNEGLIWTEEVIERRSVDRVVYFVREAVILQVKSINRSLALVLKPTLRICDIDGVDAPKEVANSIKVKILGWQHNDRFNEALRKWHRLLLSKGTTQLRFPDSDDGIRFSISSRAIVAKVTDERSQSITLNAEQEAMAVQTGLQLPEPRLSFLPASGRGVAQDTHPMRGLVQNRPFDAVLTDSGFATEIRVAVIAPSRDGRKVCEYLATLHEPISPATGDADYLMDFPGFATAFKCSLVITRPGNAGFHGLDEPKDTLPTSARELAARIVSAISALKASVNPSVTVIYIPARWSALRLFDENDEHFDLHDFIKAAAIPQGCSTQFLEENTLLQDKQCRVRWWLSLATYAKAMRSPWALQGLDKDSAYVGIGFSLKHRPGQDGHVVLGCSHLYSPNGLGLQFRLSKVENPIMRRKKPFMSFDDARRLGEGIRELFFEANLRLPQRVVVHKQTPFLKEEREGLQAGLDGVENIELLQIHLDDTLRYIASKTLPDGTVQIDGYPIRRGTTVVVDDMTALLWVHGASTALNPRKKYYQGKRRIPAPLVLTRHAGKSDLMTLADEILGLSKMNFNSFDLYGQLPATIETSRRVAKIGAMLDRYAERSYDYRLFM